MPITQRKPSLYPDKETSLEKPDCTTTFLEELSSTLKQFPQHPSEESPPDTKDTKRYSAKRNHRDYLDTLFGTMPLNYFQGLRPHYLDDSSPLPKARLPKHKSS